MARNTGFYCCCETKVFFLVMNLYWILHFVVCDTCVLDVLLFYCLLSYVLYVLLFCYRIILLPN